MAQRFEYNDWVEVKRALKANKGNVSDATDDVDWGRTTVGLVKKSKSFKDYQRLTRNQ